MDSVLPTKLAPAHIALEVGIRTKPPAVSKELEAVLEKASGVYSISDTGSEAKWGTAAGPCTKTASKAQFCTSGNMSLANVP